MGRGVVSQENIEALPEYTSALCCEAVPLSLLIEVAFAQSLIPAGSVAGCDFATGSMTASCIPNFLAHVLSVIFGFTGGICLIMIMIAGYQYAVGEALGGGKEAGKERLKYAIAGFAVSALAIIIIQFFVAAIL